MENSNSTMKLVCADSSLCYDTRHISVFLIASSRRLEKYGVNYSKLVDSDFCFAKIHLGPVLS